MRWVYISYRIKDDAICIVSDHKFSPENYLIQYIKLQEKWFNTFRS